VLVDLPGKVEPMLRSPLKEGHMNQGHRLTVTALAVILIAASCGGSASRVTRSTVSTASAGATSAPRAQANNVATAPATVATGNSRLGRILVDGQGRTLYLFVPDRGTTSTCYGACAVRWPPFLTSGAPTAGPGANASLIGTTKRTDGTVEVTYNGHPLYYWVGDSKPGDVTGQAINDSGGLWYVLNPAGTAITSAPSPGPRP